MLYLRLAWRNLWRNRRRTLITVFAVAFAGFFVIAMRSLQTGAYDNMVRNTVGTYTGFLQVHQDGYWDEKIIDNSFEESESIRETILQQKGVSGVSPRITGFSLLSYGLKTRGVQVEGFNPDYEAQLELEERVVAGTGRPEYGAVIGSDLAEYLKVEVGDSLVFLGQGYHGQSANALLPIEGIVSLSSPMLNQNTAFINLKMAQYVFAADNRITAYAINTEPDADLYEVESKIREALNKGELEVMNWQDMLPELVQSIQADSAGGILMAGVLYIVVGFSLLGTFIMLAAERKREYGMLIGLGMRRGQLMRLALLEASALAVLGVLLAVVLTRPLTLYFHFNPIQFTGQAMEALREMGMEPSMPASIDWSIPLTHGAILLVLTLGISLYSLVSIKRIQPVNAMRS
ncbi:ABC transporter permease [Phaeocystidibacter luteus]|uniref:ABC transporter permease n=1 Tax=Phaeocystidibacter luteus TaxID=911197 RepID=A0A6N6RHJ3_9FLAO|nr:ABC transporter permease [Phaeocystidibacter luteus]KAB2813848.1 ABC transporter permease [Phaeocystidibacter luteus]